jgi:hypothetical protein
MKFWRDTGLYGAEVSGTIASFPSTQAATRPRHQTADRDVYFLVGALAATACLAMTKLLILSYPLRNENPVTCCLSFP